MTKYSIQAVLAFEIVLLKYRFLIRRGSNSHHVVEFFIIDFTMEVNIPFYVLLKYRFLSRRGSNRHHVVKFFIIDFPIEVNIRFYDEETALFVSDCFANIHHDITQLFFAYMPVSISIEYSENRQCGSTNSSVFKGTFREIFSEAYLSK